MVKKLNAAFLHTHSRMRGEYSPKPSYQSGTYDSFLGHIIDHGRLKLVQKLGKGTYGVVYRAVEQWTNVSVNDPSTGTKDFAVKVIEKSFPQSRHWMYRMREIAAHRTLSKHPNIITLHRVAEDDDYYYLIMDYCPGGDLFQVMERASIAGKVDVIKSVFLQLLDAVEFCHQNGIAHRDIKLENIFATSEDAHHVVLGDFGLVTWAEQSVSHGCGSGVYMSPECIGELYDYKPFSVQKNDIWSLGIILLNIITGFNPWSIARMKDACFRDFVSDPDSFRVTLPISVGANDILKSIFTLDPCKRITIPELRAKVSALDTFFMSQEEVNSGCRALKNAAQKYWENVPVKYKISPAPRPPVAIRMGSGSVTLCSTSTPSPSATAYSSSSGDAAGSRRLIPENSTPSLMTALKVLVGKGGSASSGGKVGKRAHLSRSLESVVNRLTMLFV